MSDRRRAQKNHIRAARDWLGQAENSLDQENDVRGDLRLMLAKAELAQVKDSPRGAKIKRWAGRLLPALVAVVLVAAGMAIIPHGGKAPAGQEQDASLSTETVGESEKPTGKVLPRQEGEAEPAAPAPVQPRVASEVPQKAPPEAAKEQPVQPQSERSAAIPQKSGQVPDAETQKLMQSAGKALRQ